jgi:hypothetical protein
MGTPLLLLEDVYTGRVGADRIDREKGVIRGVKLLGESGNHDYPKATREAARALLEGGKVFVDHPEPGRPGRGRSVRDRMGGVRDVREKGDGLYGDWHFPPTHPLAEAVFWAAENDPRGVGFSINAHAGRTTRKGGRVVVEEIAALNSIDLVDSPATTSGLFEGRNRVVSTPVRQLIEWLTPTRPGYARGLREAAEAGILSPDAAMDAPPDAAGASESGDHEAALKAGFKAAVVAVVDDDSLDLKAKLKRMRDILRAQEKLIGADDKGDGETDMASEESKKAAQGGLLEAERRLTRALRQINEKGVRLTPLVEMALAGCKSDDDVKRLVESLTEEQRPRGQQPRSAAPPAAPTRQEQQRRAVQESRQAGDGADQIPTDAKGFGRWLKTPD